MRLLKVAFAGLITVVALLFSLMVAVGVAAIGLVVYLYLRLRGKSAAVRFGGAPQAPPTDRAPHDVIDVTATEVGQQRLDR